VNRLENKNVRQVALELLIRIEKEGAFSHLLIHQAIDRNNIKTVDENLLTEIVYGTIENKLTLDFYLQPFIQKQKKITDWVLILLRMSVYQLVYLDKIPVYAVINEAVHIAKVKGHRGIASFVNGVLRNVERQGVRNTSEIKNPINRLAIETSHPLWLVQLWVDAYGFEITEQICKTNKMKKPMTVRANRLKGTREEVLDVLNREDIKATLSEIVDQAIQVEQGNVLKSNVMKDGYITVQDVSSMLAANFLQVEPEMSVLDTCSAPGGKATYMAEAMDNTGTVYSYDLHKNKIKLIENHAKRLGLTNIQVQDLDARKLQTIYEKGTFDRILVDAPCTGFGVIRSKPDITYHKSLEDIKRLQTIQLNILQEVAPLLKKDGKLVYSTCTINPLENEEVVQQFLEYNPTFTVDDKFLLEINHPRYNKAKITDFGMQIFPQTFNSDGFFITRLIHK